MELGLLVGIQRLWVYKSLSSGGPPCVGKTWDRQCMFMVVRPVLMDYAAAINSRAL